MRNAGLNETQAGIKIAKININNLRYADDTTLMAERSLCDLMSYSLPGFSTHGIFQAGILEPYTAISFSRGSSQPRDQTLCFLHWPGGSLPAELPGKPYGLNSCPRPSIHMSKP